MCTHTHTHARTQHTHTHTHTSLHYHYYYFADCRAMVYVMIQCPYEHKTSHKYHGMYQAAISSRCVNQGQNPCPATCVSHHL